MEMKRNNALANAGERERVLSLEARELAATAKHVRHAAYVAPPDPPPDANEEEDPVLLAQSRYKRESFHLRKASTGVAVSLPRLRRPRS